MHDAKPYAPQLIEIAGPTSRRAAAPAHPRAQGPADRRRRCSASSWRWRCSRPLLAPYDPYAQDLANRRLIPPIWHEQGTWAHLLGTDNLGRDYLSRMIYGARISLLIGIAVMVISGLIGSTLGLAAGYFGGRVDMVVTFIVTVRLAMPVILVALAVVAMVGGSLLVVMLVLGLLNGTASPS